MFTHRSGWCRSYDLLVLNWMSTDYWCVLQLIHTEPTAPSIQPHSSPNTTLHYKVLFEKKWLSKEYWDIQTIKMTDKLKILVWGQSKALNKKHEWSRSMFVIRCQRFRTLILTFLHVVGVFYLHPGSTVCTSSLKHSGSDDRFPPALRPLCSSDLASLSVSDYDK